MAIQTWVEKGINILFPGGKMHFKHQRERCKKSLRKLNAHLPRLESIDYTVECVKFHSSRN